jgi:hypothetical protein
VECLSPPQPSLRHRHHVQYQVRHKHHHNNNNNNNLNHNHHHNHNYNHHHIDSSSVTVTLTLSILLAFAFCSKASTPLSIASNLTTQITSSNHCKRLAGSTRHYLNSIFANKLLDRFAATSTVWLSAFRKGETLGFKRGFWRLAFSPTCS